VASGDAHHGTHPVEHGMCLRNSLRCRDLRHNSGGSKDVIYHMIRPMPEVGTHIVAKPRAGNNNYPYKRDELVDHTTIIIRDSVSAMEFSQPRVYQKLHSKDLVRRPTRLSYDLMSRHLHPRRMGVSFSRLRPIHPPGVTRPFSERPRCSYDVRA